ncbi:peptidyl-prolyl cis-trans isomerase Fkbp12-like [Liolophura sinensis]|uniref:peptidyl-prolyl cis-trans isomerase Fkbp12-like n=1 Tax=Liolophura sinensis TaxID=3198878 RepID=UPI0031583CB1
MLGVNFEHCLLVALAITLSLLQYIDCKKQKELEIIVQHKPDDCSTVADNGDEVAVHYTGYLDTGAVFDSSVQQQREPLKFVLGQKKVIQGWEQGIKGMCVGEKRRLIIPPHLAYGKQGHPPVIPASATLTFETELIELKQPGFEQMERTIFQTIQFLAFPAMALYVIYYLYNRYRQESIEDKAKDGRRKKRR